MEQVFCPLPWNNIATKTTGDLRVCCHASHEQHTGLLQDFTGAIANLGEVSVDHARNHEFMKEVRAAFRAGEWHPTCSRCRKEEAHGIRSARVHALTRLEEAGQSANFQARALSQTALNGSIELEEFPLEELDIRFGNHCNLRCRSCGPDNSSAWYRDHYELNGPFFWDGKDAVELVKNEQGSFTASLRKYRWYEGVDLEAQMPKRLDGLRRIYLVGGEALLIKEHKKFLELLVEKGVSENITLEYNTNLTVLPDEIIDLWRQFKFVGVGISFDGVGPYHEYLRYPGKFSVMEKNMRKLDDLALNCRGWITTTVSSYNVCHIPEIILWKEKQGYKKIVNNFSRPPISCHFVNGMPFMSIKNLPQQAKELVAKRLDQGMERIRQETSLPEGKLRSTENLFRGFVSYMNSAAPSADWPKYWAENQRLDIMRGQSFAHLDAELYALLAHAAKQGVPGLSLGKEPAGIDASIAT